MKNILTTIGILSSTLFFSQVIIGDDTGTATDKTSVLLEFANTGNKGIILPYLRSLPSYPTAGTIILDATDETAARVKYYNGEWFDLSGQDANVVAAMTIQPDISVDETDSKAIIGATSSTADGVLVLESDTKAMVLPTVESIDDIPSPSPGMMVYLNKTNAKRLAVYNGYKWSYWRAE